MPRDAMRGSWSRRMRKATTTASMRNRAGDKDAHARHVGGVAHVRDGLEQRRLGDPGGVR
eukprot:3598290-Rhodomonas_salina.4